MTGDIVYAASCSKNVTQDCVMNVCPKYSKGEGIADPDCRELCKTDPLLIDLNTKKREACEAGSSDWKHIKTEEWNAKVEEWLEKDRGSRSDGNPFYNVCRGEMTVKEATAFCEPVVINHCKQVTAPKYCEIKKMDSCDVDALCVLDLDSARLAAKKAGHKSTDILPVKEKQRRNDLAHEAADRGNDTDTDETESMSEARRQGLARAHEREDREREHEEAETAASQRADEAERGLLERNTDKAALDAQNSAQLMACIAAKRDPFNQKTGRPMVGCDGRDKLIPWCKIVAPSWRDTVESPDDKTDRKASICSGDGINACSSAEDGMTIPDAIHRRRGGDECAAPGREDGARRIFNKKSRDDDSRDRESNDLN